MTARLLFQALIMEPLRSLCSRINNWLKDYNYRNYHKHDHP